MRLYHKDHGYHFVTSDNELAELTEKGWVAAPKGFQKTLKQGTLIVEVAPKRRGPKPKVNQ